MGVMVFFWFYRDNGKENGNYYQKLKGAQWERHPRYKGCLPKCVFFGVARVSIAVYLCFAQYMGTLGLTMGLGFMV